MEDIEIMEELKERANEALELLDEINRRGTLDYSDYCELHDAISEIIED